MTEIATKPVVKALDAIIADLDAIPLDPRGFAEWQNARGKVWRLREHLREIERIAGEVLRDNEPREQLKLPLRWRPKRE